MGEILDFIKMASEGHPYIGDGIVKCSEVVVDGYRPPSNCEHGDPPKSGSGMQKF